MSTATRKLNYATIGNYDITAGQTVTVGFAVTLDSDTTVRNAAGGIRFAGSKKAQCDNHRAGDRSDNTSSVQERHDNLLSTNAWNGVDHNLIAA